MGPRCRGCVAFVAVRAAVQRFAIQSGFLPGFGTRVRSWSRLSAMRVFAFRVEKGDYIPGRPPPLHWGTLRKPKTGSDPLHMRI
jgi:hypothetical protein